MAQDVISTLFGITPRNVAFDQYTQERMIDVNKAGSQYADLGRANIERASAMMQNAGTGLGIGLGRLLGGQTPQMAEEQRVQGMLGGASLQDPEQLMMAAERFAQAGDLPRAKALQDAALDMEKTKADIARINALASGTGRGAGGTGPERMASFVANVQARLQAGEDVPQEEILRAQNFADVLSKNQFFKMEDGSIVSVPKNDFGKISQLLRDGAVEVAAPTAAPAGMGTPAAAAPATGAAQAPAPAARPTGGATVIETPSSIAQKQKQVTSLQSQIDTIQSDLTNIDEATKMVNKFSTGLVGSALSILPTDARRLRKLVEGIDAAKVFNELSKLREASASGASGLGQVTEREISLLMNRVRVLDPGGREEDLIKDLQYISKAWKDIQDKIKVDLGEKQPSSSPTEKVPPRVGAETKGNTANEALINRVMADPRNKGKTRQQIEAGLRRRGLIQ